MVMISCIQLFEEKSLIKKMEGENKLEEAKVEETKVEEAKETVGVDTAIG